MERRFQPVTIAEPSIEETVEVLMGIKPYYESYHRVRVPDDIGAPGGGACQNGILHDRFLPDKAIDLSGRSLCLRCAAELPAMAEYDALSVRCWRSCQRRKRKLDSERERDRL